MNKTWIVAESNGCMYPACEFCGNCHQGDDEDD